MLELISQLATLISVIYGKVREWIRGEMDGIEGGLEQVYYGY